MKRRHLSIYATAAVLLLAAGGCVAPPAREDSDTDSAVSLVWPQPPAPARIRYLRSLTGPRDLGIRKPLFQRVLDALAGRGDEHFVRPTGVAEHDGVLYVADPGAPAVWILDPTHGDFVKVTTAGGEALASPVAVAVRPDAAVFVADTGLRKVFLLDRNGKLIEVAAQQDLLRPAGLAYDAANRRLYVADSSRHRISVYGPGADLIRTWGQPGDGEGQLNSPTHLAIGRAGTLLVTDALNFRVQAFDSDGRFLWKLGRHGDGSGDLAAPKGLAIDSAGHLLIADALFDAVQIFDSDGTFLLAFGERGTRAGQFSLPGGLFVNPHDQIYVADAYNQRIQVLRRITEDGQ